MNEILGLVGGIFIVGASYLFADKKVKDNERLQNRINKLENENHDLWTDNLKNKGTIKKLDYTVELKEEIIKNQKVVIDKRDKVIKELHETILFDNDVLIQKTEKLDQANNRFAKDQIEIADLTHDICVANTELAMSRYEEIRYLRRKLKRVRASRLKKVINAEKLGGVE